jgi:glycosyltransferase involved in cell wall biosynthesis
MHILILNIDYPPDSTDTATVVQQIAEVFARRHRVTVLAGRPSYDPRERHGYYLLRRDVQDALAVERVGSLAFSRRTMAGRLANYVSYGALALARGLALKPDVVVAMTSPPLTGFLGGIIASAWRRPLVYNIRDLHPDMALASGVVKPGPLVSLWKWGHQWVLRRAQAIVVLGDDMKRLVAAKDIPAERIFVVRNGAPPADSAADRGHPVAKTIRGSHRFLVLHAGNLGYAGAWDTILQAAAGIDDDSIGFAFVGNGASRERLVQQAAGSRNVWFFPYFPPDAVPHVLAAGDLHIVTVKSNLVGLVVPGKLFPILAAGRPVLAVAPEASDVSQIVREHNCGLVASPDDPAAVAAAVRWARDHPQEMDAMGERARRAAQRFDRRAMIAQFLDIVQALGPKERPLQHTQAYEL